MHLATLGVIMEQFILKFKYRLDKFMKKGIYHQLIILFFIVMVFTITTSYIVAVAFSFTYLDALWASFMHLIDPGTITGQESDKVMLIAFFVIMTFAGIFIWSSVVAILNEGLRNKLDELRNGQVFIQEEHHAVILGWNDAVVPLVDEYFSSDDINVIVLLSSKPKEDVEQQISGLDRGNTEIIIREADPLDIGALTLLNIEHCKSVVVMSNSDARSLKIILALKKAVKNTSITVSTIIHEKEFEIILDSLSDKKMKIYSIYETYFLLKMMAQSTVFSGLAMVYNELFSYNGNEFYIIPNNQTEATVENIAKEYLKNRGLLIGYIENGKVYLAPNRDSILPNKCDIIILAQENPIAPFKSEELELPSTPNALNLEHNILIISDDSNNELLKEEIDQYCKDKTIYCFDYKKLMQEKNKIEYLANYFKKHKINRILLLSPNGESDEDIMALLILIRHAIRKDDSIDCTVLTGMNSVQNRNLITFDDFDDFIVSSKLLGMLLGQSSLKPALLKIFIEILNTDGKELGIINVDANDVGFTFEELYLKFLHKEFALIGIRREGIFINPMPTSVILERDQLIVIADIV